MIARLSVAPFSSRIFGFLVGVRVSGTGEAAEDGSAVEDRCQRDAHAARRLGDPGGDLDEAERQGGEFGVTQLMGGGHAQAQFPHDPEGGGVEDETDLVRERGAAAGSIGGELCPVELDQGLGLAARAVDAFVEMHVVALRQAGHDEARVDFPFGRKEARDDAAHAPPGAGGVGETAMAPQRVAPLAQSFVRQTRRERGDAFVEYGVAGQAEDMIDAVGLAPLHHRRPPVMAVAAQRDAGVPPMAADATEQATKVAAQLDARWRLAGAQDHRDRARRSGVADMDRQEAAHVVMRVEERQLLLAVDGIDGIVDVEHDARRYGPIAGAVEIHELAGRFDGLAQTGRVLQARHRRLRAERLTGLGQSTAGQLEGGIVAQRAEIVGVLVATGNGQDARKQDVGHAVPDARRIAIVRDRVGEVRGHLEMPLGTGEQQDAAVTGQPTTVEGGDDFLARDGWQGEEKKAIVGSGECGCHGHLEGVFLNG